MKTRFYQAAVLFFCLAFLPFSATADGLSTISKDEIIAALTDLESVFKSYSVQIRLNTLEQSPLDEKIFLKSNVAMDVKQELGARFHFVEVGDIPYLDGSAGNHDGLKVPSDKRPRRLEGAFNGEELREITGQEGEAGNALIHSKPEGTQWRIKPQVYLTFYFHKTILEWISSGDASVVGDDNIEGIPAVVVETKPVLVNNIEWKQKFWLAPSLNFAAVKRSANLRRYPDGKWIEYTRILTSDYQNAYAGVFVPGRGVYESFRVGKGDTDPDKTEYPTTSRHELIFKNWEVNPPLSDDDFKVEFPNHTFVNNKITGDSYSIERLTDKDIANQVFGANQINHKSIKMILVYTNIAIFVMLIGIMIFRRSHKNTQNPDSK